MSIFNNNDFTLSTEAQQAIETICVNLSLDDVRLGMQYNGIYPIYDNDTDNYIGSVNLETLEFTYDLIGFVNLFFATDIFNLGNERANEIEDSDNVRVAIIEELEKMLQESKIDNVVYVSASEIETISKENNYESVVTRNNCIFELEWDSQEEDNLLSMQFISCTDFGGNLLHDTDHENGGQAYNGIEFDLVQSAGGSFADYAYLKGAKAMVKVELAHGFDCYYLA